MWPRSLKNCPIRSLWLQRTPPCFLLLLLCSHALIPPHPWMSLIEGLVDPSFLERLFDCCPMIILLYIICIKSFGQQSVTNWPILDSFWSFQTSFQFYHKYVEKYPSNVWCWDSNSWPLGHNHLPWKLCAKGVPSLLMQDIFPKTVSCSFMDTFRLMCFIVKHIWGAWCLNRVARWLTDLVVFPIIQLRIGSHDL